MEIRHIRNRDLLSISSYLYLLLPCLVFLLFYVRAVIGIPVVALLVVTYYLIIHSKDGKSERLWQLSPQLLLLLAAIAVLWCFFGGQGGFWYQSSDWNERNAIYRDLITHDWPVVYENKGTALSYYIGHWLVPGIIAHAIYIIAGLNAAWVIGNVLLLFWTSLGVFLILWNICVFLNSHSVKKILLSCLIFMCFSGLDIIGSAYRCNIPYVFSEEALHLEWWFPMEISSITTCLFWVFNQTVAPWLATILFLQEEGPQNYVFLVLSALICGPMPTLGLCALMLVKVLASLISAVRGKYTGTYLRQLFSVRNILPVLTTGPIFALYYATNGSIQLKMHVISEDTMAIADRQPVTLKQILFMLTLEVGIYLILLLQRHKKDPVYWSCVAIFTIAPFIRVGGAYDFTMRFTIPAIFVLALYSAEMVLSRNEQSVKINNKYRLLTNIMIVTLVIGSCTPLMEFYRGYYNVRVLNNTSCDDLISLENASASVNFESYDYENTWFFRYVAKRH